MAATGLPHQGSAAAAAPILRGLPLPAGGTLLPYYLDEGHGWGTSLADLQAQLQKVGGVPCGGAPGLACSPLLAAAAISLGGREGAWFGRGGRGASVGLQGWCKAQPSTEQARRPCCMGWQLAQAREDGKNVRALVVINPGNPTGQVSGPRGAVLAA